MNATIREIETKINELLDELSFGRSEMRFDGCDYNRDQQMAGVRVCVDSADERLHMFVFAPGPGHLLAYEIALPFAAPFSVIRATIEAAVNCRAPLGRR